MYIVEAHITIFFTTTLLQACCQHTHTYISYQYNIPSVPRKRTEPRIVMRPGREVVVLRGGEQVRRGAPALQGRRRGLAVGRLRGARPV